MSECEWLLVQSSCCFVTVPGMDRSGSVLPGIPSSGSAEVLHCGILWNWKLSGLHVDIHADRGSIGWFGLHRGLLRGTSHASFHNKRDLQENAAFSVKAPGGSK